MPTRTIGRPRTKPPPITAEQARHALARQAVDHFLGFVKIQEPPSPTNPQGGAVIPFIRWTHLMNLVMQFTIASLICILKARQVGVSWLLAAYALWMAQYHSGAVVLLISRGEKEAQILLDKCRIIYKLLPEGLQEKIDPNHNNRTELWFLSRTPDSLPGKITALPSTEHAGRGETASVVIQDEADYHEHLDGNYAAVKPTIDAGGQLIMASTSNKLRMITTFKEIIKNAPSNGWLKFFFPWNVRPGRTQQWYEWQRANAPTTERLSPDLYMEQEYPGTEEEALAPSRALAAFDIGVLNDMQKDVKPALDLPGLPSLAHVYQQYSVGKKYAAFTDTSHGLGQDFAVTVVMDVRTGYVAADVMGNVLSPDELAIQSVDLLKLYRNPVWGIEDNDWGISTIKAAQTLGYKNIWSDPDRNDRIGWHTDERSRYVLWGEIITAVKDRLIIVPSKEGLRQFFNVIRNPMKNGKIEAVIGANDDYPLAVGGAWQMRKYAHGGVGSAAAVRPRQW